MLGINLAWHQKTIALAGLVVSLFLAAGQAAQAYTHYLVEVQARYPAIAGSRIDNCVLCHHTDAVSYPALNGYGQAFKTAGFNLAAIENLDSDGDGYTNLAELTVLSSPANPNDRPVSPVSLTNRVYLPLILKSPLPVSNGQYVLIAWNDLGMHCMDPSYEDFAVLPPYNTLWAQVIRRGGEPRIVTQGVTVEYRILDNTFSVVKTNFWDYAHQLFNLPKPLLPNVGLKGFGLTGEMEPKGDHFAAEGIPLTEYRDSDPTTPYPYQLAELVAKDSAGNVLATTQTVAPVSTEMNCQNCHNNNGVANPNLAMPTLKQNILTLHDQQEGTNLMDQRPVLCAGCHGSNALGTPGQAGVPNLSLAMHGKHQQIDDFTQEGTCYQCHPGPTTKCLRGTMAQEGMTCQDCHGNMADVADPARQPWLDEPRCGDCHEGHAENAGTLYRFSTGHGGVYCQACHGSQHAIYPTNQPNDNIQSILLQGKPGTIDTCTVCHTRQPDRSEGPHGEGAESSMRGQSAPTTGDVNNDGVIDILDMVSISASFGSSNTTTDLNNDGTVDIYDVLTAANKYLAP